MGGIGLDIYGAGEEADKIVNISNKINVDVKLRGRVSNEKMPLIYNQYPIYVLCSKYEGNRKTLLEAMACGCAVIGIRNTPTSPGRRPIVIIAFPASIKTGFPKITCCFPPNWRFTLLKNVNSIAFLC